MIKKESLLARLQMVIESTDDVSKSFPVVQEIQQEWRSIGAIASEKYKPLVKKYHSENAMEIYKELSKSFATTYDESGSIGKRYRCGKRVNFQSVTINF